MDKNIILNENNSITIYLKRIYLQVVLSSNDQLKCKSTKSLRIKRKSKREEKRKRERKGKMRNENKHDGKNQCEYGNKFIYTKIKKRGK